MTVGNSNCPCKGCEPPKRSVGCHGKCEEYITWNKKHVKHLKALKRERERADICIDYVSKRYDGGGYK